jgi:sulfite reductase (ferredoxin)
MKEEYPDLIFNNDIKIKISGCMNSCGQHGIANIGFHGSSIKNNGKVVPALQLLLGGGSLGNGTGRFAERIIKIPSKRVPAALRILIDDYDDNSSGGEYFNDYYDRRGKNYFYQLLKPLTDLSSLLQSDYIDWGDTAEFSTAVGVGECAGVMIDLVATLLFESEEKLGWARESLDNEAYADSLYHSYSVFVSGAKALLLTKEISPTTQIGIINEFDLHFGEEEIFRDDKAFKDLVLEINQREPLKEFAESYYRSASGFLVRAKKFREIPDKHSASVKAV